MNLIYYPHKFLNKKVSDVNIEDPGFNLHEVKEHMTDIMLSNRGIGLSANQVELDYQLFIMGSETDNTIMCINPVILQHTEETTTDLEGCLSFPNIYVNIPRPKEILAKWYDENLVERCQKIENYTTKCFLHEWDHLQGVNIIDRVSKLKWNMAKKKARKLTKNA
tara:strand:- start:1319 stop:1813 length:495 start_codon:yes stop_codon:yes gene_type:complete